jgi:hypothetical protein
LNPLCHKGLKPSRLNRRVMDEYILRAFYFNKPESLLIAEPLDSTFRYYSLPRKSDLQVIIPFRILQKSIKREIPLWLVCRFL